MSDDVSVREYFEDVWRGLPADLRHPDFELRSRFLREHVRAGDRVLDLGSGDGSFTAAAAALGADVVGAEVAAAAIERARRRHAGLEFRLVPVDGPLPFEDGSFELVWSSEVIEHVADTARWLSEVRRVLKPAGRLLLTTPSHGRLRLLLGGVEQFSEPLGDHLHLYTLRSLSGLLVDFGFGDVRVRRSGGPPWLRRLLLASAAR